MEKTTDLVHLDFLLKEVEQKIKELNVIQTEKYSNKQQKKDLEVFKITINLIYCIFFKIYLIDKIKVRDEKKVESYVIKNKIQLYKLIFNIAKDYYDNKTQFSSLQDAISKCIINNFMKQNSRIIK